MAKEVIDLLNLPADIAEEGLATETDHAECIFSCECCPDFNCIFNLG